LKGNVERTASRFAGDATRALLCVAVIFAGCSPRPHRGGERRELLVFAAASLKDVLGELSRPFETQTGISPVFNFAGSNVLALQIEASPQSAQVFLSADENWMDHVDKAGLIEPGSRRAFLSNRLVIIANRDNPLQLPSPAQLADADFRYLSLADPEAVPAGRYARRFMEHVAVGDTNLWTRVKDRVAPAPDVRAALALVEAQKEIIGIVYRTDAAISKKVRVVLDVPEELTPAIRYSCACIRNSRDAEAARAFLDFLASPEAVAVFRAHGFVTLGDGRQVGR
jgi:molybdate transport system substrate-binding protein